MNPGSASVRVGLAFVAFVVLASAIGHFALPAPDAQNLAQTLAAPSLGHLFGTDDLGRDVLSRTLAGTWIDLGVAFGATYLSVLIGVLAGTVAGYIGGWPERVIMRLADVVIAFPFIVLVIAVVAVLGPGIKGAAIGLVVAGWAFYARLSHAEMRSLREREFIQAARTLGFSHRRIVLRHALPNIVRPSLTYSVSDTVLNILYIASLSYLGLGVQPPGAEWGVIIADGQQYLLTAWWISTLPGLVVILVGIGLVLIGDGTADRFRVNRYRLQRELAR
ncbi:MAG TPA: ABC transporter permease [Solirubrobacteraceae bacterium]|jgi:peptide/nickel transport system permease protein